MIIYLEGADGSGKTTLAKKLANQLRGTGYEVVEDAEKLMSTHPTRPNRVDKETLLDVWSKCLKDNKYYIFDRGPLSDIIYRVFDNYEPVISLGEFSQILQSNLRSNKLKLIYCDSEEAYQAMLNRGEDSFIAVSKHAELRKLYRLVMTMFSNSPNYQHYDFSQHMLVKE